MFNSFLYVWNSIDGDGTIRLLPVFSSTFMFIVRSVLIDRPLIYGSSSYKLTKLESKVLRLIKPSVLVSRRSLDIKISRLDLCEPN